MISFAFHKRFDVPFDTGQRTFDQPYLLHASQGTFHLETEARTWLLLPHRAALIRRGVSIRIWTVAPTVSSSVLFDAALDELFPSPCQIVAVTPLMVQMIAYATRWNEQRAQADQAAPVFFKALAQVAVEAAQTPDQAWFPRAQSADLQRAVACTLSGLGSALRFADVAAAACISERTLTRRFAEELGMSWQQFLQRVRVIHAAKLLTLTRKPVTEIAYAAGMSSASALAAQFRNLLGETPTAYRRRLRG